MNHVLLHAARVGLLCACMAGLAAAFDNRQDGSRAIGDPWWDEAEAAAAAAQPKDAGDEAALEAALAVRHRGLEILRRELSLVRQTCPSLENQQRAIVLEAGRGAIDKAVAEQDVARPKSAASHDLEARIRDSLRATLKANASDAELAAYEAEQGLRQERLKKAVVAAIVADVDREAYLNDAERDALATTLGESYRERWQLAFEAMAWRGVVSNETILPGVERCVEKAVGPERKFQWLAARDEARRLEGNRWAVVGGGFEVAAPGPPPGRPAVRVIQRMKFGGGGAVLQLRVQAEAAPANEQKKDEAAAAEEDRK